MQLWKNVYRIYIFTVQWFEHIDGEISVTFFQWFGFESELAKTGHQNDYQIDRFIWSISKKCLECLIPLNSYDWPVG